MNETIDEKLRKIQIREIYNFIQSGSIMECAKILEEILCVHKNLTAFDPFKNEAQKIESICINEECIQLNIVD